MLHWKDKALDTLSGKKIAKNFTTYLILFAALGAMVFFGVCDPSSRRMIGGGSLSGAAAKVDGTDIPSIDFRRAYQRRYAEYQERYKDGFDPAAFRLSAAVLNELENEYIIYVEAMKDGFYVSDRDIEKFLTGLPMFKDDKGKFSAELFENFLRSNAFSEASLTDAVRRQLIIQKFSSVIMDTYYVSNDELRGNYQLRETKLNVQFIKLDKDAGKVNVSDADVTAFLAGAGKDKVKTYYDTNKAEFHTDKKVKARHILIAFTEARNATGAAKTRTKDAAKKLAGEVLAQLQSKKGDFKDLAAKYSDDISSKAKGGDLGFFAKEAMVPEFSNAAFALTEGQTSGIVESPFGFHTINVEKIEPEKNQSLADATRDIAKKLLIKERKPKVLDELSASLITNIKQNNTAAVNKLLTENNLKWEETGEFAFTARYIPKVGADDSAKAAIFSLKTPSQMVDKLVDVNGNKFLFKLKERKEANPALLDEKRLAELRKTDKMIDSYGLNQELDSYLGQQYREKGEIWENPDYRDLDQRHAEQGKRKEN